MLERLIQWDTAAFCWINSHYCTAADWVLWTLSQGWSWAIVLIAIFCTTTLRIEKKNWWIVLLCIAACFLLGDRISVMCFKDVVCRLRPCHVLENVRMFHTSCGGRYGFVSSHACNIAALAMMLTLRYRSAERKSRIYWFGILVWLWAVAVMYSRPYLGKHYPGDLVCGALVGMGIGALVYFVCRKLETRYQQVTDTNAKKDKKK